MTAANIASGAPWSSAMPSAPSGPEKGIYPKRTARPRVPTVFVRLPAIAAIGMLQDFLPHPAYTRYDTMPIRRRAGMTTRGSGKNLRVKRPKIRPTNDPTTGPSKFLRFYGDVHEGCSACGVGTGMNQAL